MRHLWMLKNTNTNEICDVFAETLEKAIQIAVDNLGGNKADYIKRF